MNKDELWKINFSLVLWISEEGEEKETPKIVMQCLIQAKTVQEPNHQDNLLRKLESVKHMNLQHNWNNTPMESSTLHW